jgi:hypoxanthine phosphoribosyltransferase
MIASREPGIESVLLTEEQVQGRVRDLAAQISKDYAGRDVLLVGVLKGAFILMADLARHLTVPHEFDERLVNGLGGLADAIVDLRALECVQDLQQCRLVKGHRACVLSREPLAWSR